MNTIIHSSLSMSIKYVIRPGFINGTYSHMRHFDADTLMELYQVQRDECVILHDSDPRFKTIYTQYASKGYIFLYPRSDGNYSWLNKCAINSD